MSALAGIFARVYQHSAFQATLDFFPRDNFPNSATQCRQGSPSRQCCPFSFENFQFLNPGCFAQPKYHRWTDKPYYDCRQTPLIYVASCDRSILGHRIPSTSQASAPSVCCTKPYCGSRRPAWSGHARNQPLPNPFRSTCGFWMTVA